MSIFAPPLSFLSSSSGYSITNSARFVSGNSAYLTRTPGAASNRTTYTLSTWVKRGALSVSQMLFQAGTASQFYVQLTAADKISINSIDGAGTVALLTTQVFRDVGAWYHVVIAVDTNNATAANRVRLYVNGLEVTAFDTRNNPGSGATGNWNNNVVHNFGRLNGGSDYADCYVANVTHIDGSQLTPSSFGQTNASGVWVPKAYSGTYGTNGFFLDFGNSSYLGYDVKTSGVTTKFTNSSEWTGDTGDFSSLAQNIVPTGGNVGGIRTNDTFTGDFAVQFQWQNGTNPAYLSVYDTVENATFNSAIADAGVNSMTNAFQMYFGAASVVDAKRGVTGTVSAGIFTASAGDWIKLQRSGSTFTCYQNGTLKYTWVATSSATMRIVVSQNSSSMDWRSFTWTNGSTTPANSFYVSGLVAGDQMSDTPTLNYPVISTLDRDNGGTWSVTSGNLVVGNASTTLVARATMGVTSGKYYWEQTLTAWTASSAFAGVIGEVRLTGGNSVSAYANGYGIYPGNGNKYNNGANSAYGTSFAAGAVIATALDMDNGKVWWGVASGGTVTWYNSGVPASGTGAAYTTLSGRMFPCSSPANDSIWTYNFGQKAFTGAAPTGFVALNTANLPAPAIKDGSAHFQTALHTGTGSAITINQTGNSTFTSDFVWTKGRSGATNHVLSNIISGTGKYLSSNSTAAETTDAQALTAFGAGSISYGTLAAANTNAATYVDWMWKGGGAGVSNSVGSITSTVSTNTTAGIAVVTWTGTGVAGTIGHGLGVAPQLIIVKRRSSTGDWQVYHTSTGIGNYLLLDTTAASAADTLNVRWNNAAPTSTVFSVGTNADVNFLTGTFVAYCFAPIAGFSAFGSYTGNGSADGAFIYLGFRPAFVLIKSSSAVDDWRIYDSSRPGYNVQGGVLLPDTAGAETTTAEVDLLSNGFKCRIATTPNAANTMIYAAFASNPFGGSGAAPATAR